MGERSFFTPEEREREVAKYLNPVPWKVHPEFWDMAYGKVYRCTFCRQKIGYRPDVVAVDGGLHAHVQCVDLALMKANL